MISRIEDIKETDGHYTRYFEVQRANGLTERIELGELTKGDVKRLLRGIPSTFSTLAEYLWGVFTLNPDLRKKARDDARLIGQVQRGIDQGIYHVVKINH